jgi:hypothetical protein
LLDAVGRTINDSRVRLAALPEAKCPGLVIFVISTDGMENASKTFNNSRQAGFREVAFPVVLANLASPSLFLIDKNYLGVNSNVQLASGCLCLLPQNIKSPTFWRFSLE